MSCNFSQKQTTIDNVVHKLNVVTLQDTWVIYDIEGISTEGAEAKVNYVDGKITESVTIVYADTWQTTIVYEFEIDKIKVLEAKYFYETEIEKVKSYEDMRLAYEIRYFIDFKGDIIGNEIPDRIDIFKEFKKVVPFKLK